MHRLSCCTTSARAGNPTKTTPPAWKSWHNSGRCRVGPAMDPLAAAGCVPGRRPTPAMDALRGFCGAWQPMGRDDRRRAVGPRHVHRPHVGRDGKPGGRCPARGPAGPGEPQGGGAREAGRRAPGPAVDRLAGTPDGDTAKGLRGGRIEHGQFRKGDSLPWSKRAGRNGWKSPSEGRAMTASSRPEDRLPGQPGQPGRVLLSQVVPVGRDKGLYVVPVPPVTRLPSQALSRKVPVPATASPPSGSPWSWRPSPTRMVPAIIGLRRFLKTALRSYRLRCVRIEALDGGVNQVAVGLGKPTRAVRANSGNHADRGIHHPPGGTQGKGAKR